MEEDVEGPSAWAEVFATKEKALAYAREELEVVGAWEPSPDNAEYLECWDREHDTELRLYAQTVEGVA